MGSQRIPSHTMAAALDTLDESALWALLMQMTAGPHKRKKLPGLNTLSDLVQLIDKSKKIVILTGAGISVSCGIPDFRSKDGIYARLAVDYPDLPDPQAMFDIDYFKKDPRPFFKFAREIYPGQFNPSPCHKFIRVVEERGKLLRNYTQNIDTLEQVAGIKNVIQCHGSFATASCMKCSHRVQAEEIKEDIFAQRIPKCSKCDAIDESAVMKPDIVFFGEPLDDEYYDTLNDDLGEVDLLIMIGSSLKVNPVANIPQSISSSVPQILINREPLSHLYPDIELLGDCDGIINQLCCMLGQGWEEPIFMESFQENTKPSPNDEGDDEGKVDPSKEFTFIAPNRAFSGC